MIWIMEIYELKGTQGI